MKWILIGVTLFIIVAAILVVVIPAPTHAPTISHTASSTPATLDDLITITSPLPNAGIEAPLHVTGEARGNFYFEAVFPVELLDASGTPIAQTAANAQGDWMVTDYVPFTATLNFAAQPSGSHGTLVLKNDNPSGDPSKQKELDIPITFK